MGHQNHNNGLRISLRRMAVSLKVHFAGWQVCTIVSRVTILYDPNPILIEGNNSSSKGHAGHYWSLFVPPPSKEDHLLHAQPNAALNAPWVSGRRMPLPLSLTKLLAGKFAIAPLPRRRHWATPQGIRCRRLKCCGDQGQRISCDLCISRSRNHGLVLEDIRLWWVPKRKVMHLPRPSRCADE